MLESNVFLISGNEYVCPMCEQHYSTYFVENCQGTAPFDEKDLFVMSILMGIQPKGFQCSCDRNTCALCCDDPDVPCHILFQCEALNTESLVYWQNIVKQMPLAMSGEVSELPDQIKTKYLLSGHNNSYTHEWQNLYERIADFISITYKKRHELYNQKTATVNWIVGHTQLPCLRILLNYQLDSKGTSKDGTVNERMREWMSECLIWYDTTDLNSPSSYLSFTRCKCIFIFSHMSILHLCSSVLMRSKTYI